MDKPVRPSKQGDQATAVSEQRKTDTRKLSIALKGDLDWIAMKALEKDRTRRYDSPTQLAEDVNRFLKGDAIIARPPSLSYRIGKTVRKNKAATVGIAGVLLLTTVAAGATTMLWLNTREQQIADANRQEAEIARIQKEARDAEEREKKATELLGLVERQRLEAEKKKAEAEAQTIRAVEAEEKAGIAAKAAEDSAMLAEARRQESEKNSVAAEEARRKADDAEKMARLEAQKARDAEILAQKREKDALDANESIVREKRKSDGLRYRSQYLVAEGRLKQQRFTDAWNILHQIPEEYRHFEWHLTANELRWPAGDARISWTNRTLCDLHSARKDCLTIGATGDLCLQRFGSDAPDLVIAAQLGPITDALWVGNSQVLILTQNGTLWTYDEQSNEVTPGRNLNKYEGTKTLLAGNAVLVGNVLFPATSEAPIFLDKQSKGHAERHTSMLLMMKDQDYSVVSSENGKVLFEGRLETPLPLHWALSRNGRWLVTIDYSAGCYDPALIVCDMSTGKVVRQVRTEVAGFLDVAISFDDRLFAAISMEGLLYVWSLDDGKLVNTLRLPGVQDISGSQLSWQSTDHSIAIHGVNGLRFLHSEHKQGFHVVSLPEVEFSDICYSPDGDTLLIAANDGQLYVWDNGTNSLSRKVRIGNTDDEIGSVVVQPCTDGWQAICSLNDGRVYSATLNDGHVREIPSFERISRCVLRADASGPWVFKTLTPLDGRLKKVEVLSTDGKHQPRTITFEGDVCDVTSRNDGRSAIVKVDDFLYVLEAESGRVTKVEGVKVPYQPYGSGLVFSRNGAKAMLISRLDELSVLDGSSLSTQVVIKGHTQLCASPVSMSPDGTLAVVGGGGGCAISLPPDFSVRVWDCVTGEELWSRSRDNYAADIALHPDLREFAVKWSDGPLLRYSACPPRGEQ